MALIDPVAERYTAGSYRQAVTDDSWKAAQLRRAAAQIPDLGKIEAYADVGCALGGVFSHFAGALIDLGAPLTRVVGYDINQVPEDRPDHRPPLVYKRADFLTDDETFDLVTLADVIEHVASPQDFVRRVAERTRYVILHIPLDDRLSVLMTNQFNFRLQTVGHVSFWSPASALTLLTAAGLLPLWCGFTPGFLAPSGRERWIQRLALPVRWLAWMSNPGLMAATVGGVSLAVLARGRRA